MSGHFRSFNTYLAAAATVLLLATLGCKSAEERKLDHTYTTLWLHLETATLSPDTNHVMSVTIAGATLRAQSRPILTDEHLAKASIVPMPAGGQGLRLEFNSSGSLLLDSTTTQNIRRHLVVFADFGYRYKYSKSKNISKKRWLAAPLISRRVSDGILVFSVDATPAELDQIVLGLNNAVKEHNEKWTF